MLRQPIGELFFTYWLFVQAVLAKSFHKFNGRLQLVKCIGQGRSYTVVFTEMEPDRFSDYSS